MLHLHRQRGILGVKMAGALTGRREIAAGLVIVLAAPDRPFAFEPGQYATLGLTGADGTLIQRPMSIASSADDPKELEFLVRLVTPGHFTPLLWQQPIGAPLRITGPKGRFVLQDDERTCVFVAGGTGLAPFMSMIRTLAARRHARNILLLCGVSRDSDLAWRDELEAIAASGVVPVQYVPTVSRPEESPAWTGLTGRVESIVPLQLDRRGLGPANATIYACGNPQMVDAVAALAAARGFPPEQVRRERYWVDTKKK